jgi:hypothetical protein
MSFGDPERLEDISPISVIPRDRFKLDCQVLSPSCSLSFALSLCCSPSRSLALCLSHYLSLSRSRSFSFSLAHACSLAFSLSLGRAFSLCLSLVCGARFHTADCDAPDDPGILGSRDQVCIEITPKNGIAPGVVREHFAHRRGQTVVYDLFMQSQLAFTQLTVGPCVVQIWSCHIPALRGR